MARSGGISERYGEGPVSFGVATAVTAGRLVEYVGDRQVDPAADGSLKIAGVALETCDAAGDMVDVLDEGYFDLTAAGSIDAGDTLAAATDGKVRTWVTGDGADAICGRACVAIADAEQGLCYFDAV